MYDTFQDALDRYFDQLRGVTTVAELVDITNDIFAAEKQFSTADAFYPGPDERFRRALAAHWSLVSMRVDGRFVAIDDSGCRVTFVQGDLFVVDESPRQRRVAGLTCRHARTGSTFRARWKHTSRP